MVSRRTASGRATVLVAAVAGALLALSGCDSNSSSPVTASAGASANADQGSMADIAFVQMMIPHHEQAIEMAELALDPASNASAPVQQMAGDIKAAQGPEIVLMEQWLVEWGVSSDDDDENDWPGSHADDHMDAGAMGDFDHMSGWAMGDMMGMLSDEQMADLAAATGMQFDRLWLEGMIDHHEGAVDMAEMVASESGDPAVNELADQIITTQLAEIAEMEQLLQQLP